MRTLSLIFCCVLLFWGCQSKDHSNPTSPGPESRSLEWLSTLGNRIVDESDNAIILHGVNRSGLEYQKDGNGITEEEIEFICSRWQVRVIRLPFNQDWVMNDPEYLAFMDRVIGWINKAGAYALIDLHWEDVTVKIQPIPNVTASIMWQSLAARYKDNPGVLYDIHNEAHDTNWQALAHPGCPDHRSDAAGPSAGPHRRVRA